jgi:hypothetical protein
MAYISQEKKAKIAPAVKAILKKYNVKGSLAVRNQMTLVLNLKQGSIDFVGNFNAVTGGSLHGNYVEYVQVNPYWYHDHFDGKAKAFLSEVLAAMNDGNHDNSNAMIDYFDVGWYVDVNIGKWNKSYTLVK